MHFSYSVGEPSSEKQKSSMLYRLQLILVFWNASLGMQSSKSQK